MVVPETNVYARNLAWRLFRNSADEDYLNARWAMRANMPYQFAWSAQQCLEKYLKCVLTLNGQNVTSFGHKLTKMWSIATQTSGDLIPMLLCPPKYFPREIYPRHKRFEPICSFVERVVEAGNTNRRYRYYSLSTEEYDIHKLDETVFLVRRITYPLEMPYCNGHQSYRQHLSAHRLYQPHKEFAFEKKGWKRGQAERIETFRWRNFAFCERHAIKSNKIHFGMSSINSPIYLNTRRGREGKEALSWLLSNAYFSKEDRAAITKVVLEK